jgi:protein transport protein HofC
MLVLQAVISFISYFILPKFEAIFADFGVPLPAITIVCIEATHFFIVYWPILVLLVLTELAMLFLASVSVLGILPWDLPLIDRLFVRRHSALIFRCLARLVEGNKPLAQGFATLAQTYPTRWIRKRLGEVARAVDGGDDWCQALARHGLIRPADTVLLESARRVGNLPWALREAAETSERRLVYRFQFWLQWLSPLLVLVIGAVVFMVAVSYFTPLILLIQRLAP